MNKKLSGILGIIFSIILLVYFESFIYKIIGLIGINISNYSYMTKTIIDLVIKLVMCFIIYFIYKRDFRHNRSKGNIFKSFLILVVGVIVLTGVMYLFRYVVNFLGDVFDVKILSEEFYNIFDKTLNFDLIVKIISSYVIIPYLYCTVIILSTDKLARRNDTFIVFSGLLAGIVHALSLHGTLIFVIINSLSTCLIFSILAFLYRKENSIWFTIIMYAFYLVSNVLLINYFGW